MINAWLVYDKAEYEKNRFMAEEYRVEGMKVGICFRLLLLSELSYGVVENKPVINCGGIPVLPIPEFAIVRVICPLFNRQLEQMGIRVFNSATVSEICNDKARTHQYVTQTGVDMMDTRFIRNKQLAQVLAEENRELIVKAVDGHGGSQVFLYCPERLQEVVRAVGTSDCIIQPVLKTKTVRDLRVYVLGDEIVASVMRSAKEGYRANFSLGGSCALYSLTDTEKETVKKIIRLFSFGLVGIDFLIDDNGKLIFNEIEDVVGCRMLYHCTDIPIVRMYLQWIMHRLLQD